MKSVCVLLSTYNGAQYLEEQLNSLINQRGVCLEILVRDDGSTDRTCEILDKWQNQGYLKWYKGKNKGFAMSFMDLVENADSYDYYAFCDQDDIWLPDKLHIAIEKLETLKNENKLYCSNLYAYSDGVNIGHVKRSVPHYDKYTCLVKNIAVGCTIVFSSSLRNIIIRNNPCRIIAHDFWAYQNAMLFGEVIYDNNSYILYRQHSKNLIGAKMTFVDIWKRRISNFLNRKIDGRSLQAKELLRCHSSFIGNEIRDVINLVADYNNNFMSRIKLFSNKNYTMGNMSNDILLKLKILFGKI